MKIMAPDPCGNPTKTRVLKKQAGKMLPLMVIAITALVLGAATFGLLSGKSSEQTDVSTQSDGSKDQQLAALQEELLTSLALPTDFRTVQQFELLDVNGQTITQRVFEDTWSLVFFGFTHCPDVCPITLQVMKDVVTKLEEQQQAPPQIVFVSIDPVRDTAESMKKYIAYFDETFVGITGEVNKVHKLSSSLGIVASFTANETDPDNYGVDHTASLLLVDPQRRVRAKVTPPHEAEKIIADYLTMIAAPG
ncbi:MAG: SCO family protein [Granulosicoccus sp.]